MTTRRELPSRRQASVHEVEVDHAIYTVTISYYEDGTPGEVFIDSGKSGSAIDVLLSDAAILASIALQSGVTAALLAKSMSRLAGAAFQPAAAPASAIGAAMDLLARIAAAGPFSGLREGGT